MLVPSAQAPTGWDSDYTEDAIRRFIIRQQPHWVFLQEVSGVVPPYIEDYVLIRQQTESHSGNIVTLLHKDLAELPITHSVVERCAVVSELHGMDVTIANVHLAPGKSGAANRMRMLRRIREAATTSRLLVVGDTNTRLTEDREVAKLGLATPKPPTATWDSRTNRFRKGTRGYTAYYTRFFVGGDIRVGNTDVHATPLSVDGKRFYLSDHFALSANLVIPVPDYIA